MRWALALALLVGCGPEPPPPQPEPQPEKVREEASPDSSQGRELLSTALQTTHETGGLRVKGKAEGDTRGDQLVGTLGSTSLGFFQGTFTAVIDPNGFMRFDIDERGDATSEIYSKGGRVIKRQIWETSRAQNLDGFGGDVTQLLDLESVRKHLEKAIVKDPVEVEVGGETFQDVRAVLPKSALKPPEAGDLVQQQLQFEVEKIVLDARIDPRTGQVVRLHYEVSKDSPMMDLAKDLLGENFGIQLEKKEGPALILRYRFGLEVEPGLKPEVPEEVLRFFLE